MSSELRSVAVIGAGLGGSISALYLAKLGFKVDLYESKEGILSDSSRIPAHLYSGAMYADKGEDTVRECLEDSIEFARVFPSTINKRPTILGISKQDERTPEIFEVAIRSNQEIYERICQNDSRKKVFGEPENLFSKYSIKECEKGMFTETDQKWMKSFAEYTDLTQLQSPVFRLEEYGLDMRTLAGTIEQLIEENRNIELHLKTKVKKVKNISIRKVKKMKVTFIKDGLTQKKNYCLVIDASGRNKGVFERGLGIKTKRITDVKMAGLVTTSRPT